jgi:hypothetical protein
MIDNRTWFRHIIALSLGLLIFYATSYVIIYLTIMSPATSAAIIGDGGSPSAEIASSIGALFPIPAFLWIIGIVLSKWVAF